MVFSRKKRIYLDYASTTPVSRVSLRALRAAESIVGNPSSIHEEGVLASRSLADSRTRIAAELGCKAREIIFTSGITESNSLAILGLARAMELKGANLAGTHWIVSAIEHSSVLEDFSEIERKGGRVSFADPDPRGIILPESVANLLCKETVCVSIGWANNETGVVQPLSSITRIIRTHEEKHGTRVVFHSDAGQAPLYRPPQAHTLGVDLLSLGASKAYGPHGIGCLYVNNRAELAPIILGGGQERGARAGTENVALAAGFAAALEEAGRTRQKESKRLKKMRDDFAREIVAQIPGALVNGSLDHLLPHMLNISIPNIDAEYLVLALDREGIALSTKSSCREGETASHVVAALERASRALPSEASAKEGRARNTLRFSLGRNTTVGDMKRVLRVLAAQARTLSSS
ncbi:MAG: cysteine desulfurase family protein [bacterium]|nr:cysteine desulfurase family protein [bacterium]